MEYQIPHNSNFDVEPSMDSSAVQVFMAGPFPIVHSAHVEEGDVDLDVALLIGGIPTILAATTFPLDDSWKRIDSVCQAVITNTVPAGAYRGFGATQATWASERQVDLIAERLGAGVMQPRIS